MESFTSLTEAFNCFASDGSSSPNDELVSCASTTVAEKRRRNGAARRCPVDKKEAPWQKMLDGAGKTNSICDEASRDGKYFTRRFRMPYSLFQAVIRVMLMEKWFPKFGPLGEGALDCTKNRGATLHVKVLSCLRVLGRGVVFDECFDGSGCNEESIRFFFHAFTAKFAQRLFPQICYPPKTLEDISSATRTYQTLGMGAALGSTDCTHVFLGNCPHKFKIACTGKEGRPTLAYSLSCSHQRKIYHCSAGFFGSKNDKYISKLDSFITAVGEDPIYRNFKWTMDTSETTTEERSGVFLLCDGGCKRVSLNCMQVCA
jgi:hypothetical protein